jgi:hypothetical protein
MKKVLVLLSLFAFVGFLVTPTVMAYSTVVKVAVQDDPPKADKKDGKCSTPCASDKKCDPSKCAPKDAKSGKSCCSSKAKASCDKDKKASADVKVEEKAPVPNK